ncbi:hypothetical protein AAFF_G00277890 [Aldrovandia affinis]|uniref:Uncharacterized protein n=1 Tax=Aldrovandia affinis TaxID=143900 RepID=A0AAD7RAU1_9TELE|nr:hypothetical protein AAFF_G00277890 [Aldrovandia affinis]
MSDSKLNDDMILHLAALRSRGNRGVEDPEEALENPEEPMDDLEEPMEVDDDEGAAETMETESCQTEMEWSQAAKQTDMETEMEWSPAAKQTVMETDRGTARPASAVWSPCTPSCGSAGRGGLPWSVGAETAPQVQKETPAHWPVKRKCKTDRAHGRTRPRLEDVDEEGTS